jgi:opacity protein-like surface antigen
MSIKRTLGLMFLALTLVLAPGVGNAAMWVGGQLGGHIMDNTGYDVNVGGLSATVQDVKMEPSVIGGITIGYDFVKEGFLGYDWPDWMKYFGVALDFTYNRMDIRGQQVNVNVPALGITIVGLPIPKIEGYAAVWTLLFYAHYGFLPDSEVPAGRLHPYVGVGPACLLSGVDLGAVGLGNSSNADIALVVEAGVRYFALKNVSLDTAFRYRWARPSWDFAGPTSVDMNDFNSFSFLFRASYHF